MLSCHGAPHNSVSSPYSPLPEKDTTPDNAIGDNEGDSSSLESSTLIKAGVAPKNRAASLTGAMHLDSSDMVDISDSNSMPAFAPAPAPAPALSASKRFYRKDLAISTSLSRPLHPLGLSSPQHAGSSTHSPLLHQTHPALHVQGHGQIHDARYVDSNNTIPPAVFIDSPLALDTAMGLPSPSTTGMTKSATTPALLFSERPSLSLLQGSDVSSIGERRPPRSTSPLAASNSPAAQHHVNLIEASIRSTWSTRALGNMDENPLPTPTEQGFAHMDASTMRITTNPQQELAAMLAGASLPTPTSALPTPNMLLSVSEGASTGQTAPVVAPNVSVSGLSVQPSLNQYLAELGLPLSSLLPTDLARHGTPPLSQHEGKRSAYPTQPSVHQPSLPTGLQLPSTIKAQQPPLRRGSKSGKPSTPRSSIPGSSYDPLSMDGLPVHSTPWPNTAIAATIPPILPLPSLSNTDLPPSGTAASGTHAQEQQRSSAPLNSNPSVPYPQRQQHYKPYHGPAPCGNPDPLYEYLASPTIVPGLEIIGHDYYGNYVQVLPICPDTSCSMNQDPIYLNLLQAIYAHTIPFLDLPPCSEEESKALLDGLSPSAIHPQSVQPPFLHLLPPKLPPRGGANDPTRGWSGYYQTTLGGQTALFNDQNGAGSMKQSTSLNSLKAIVGQTPLSAGQSLNRRASLAAFPPSSQINNNSALPPTNGRRSSTGSFPSVSSNNPNIMNQSNPITNPNNPARKKKNMPRTHPYKSTSAHRDENPMVMDTIMALSSSKSCGASVTGGLASFLGESHDVPDPKRKVVEKMVHMDETEYANHYMKHHRSMRKSASTTAVSLIQTMATAPKSQTLGSWACQTGSQKQAATQGLKRLQQGQGKQSDTNAGVTTVPQNAGLDGMDASDFIRAMTRSQCLLPHTNTQEPLTTTPSNDETGLPPTIASAEELAELEKIVMSMDSASVAAVQAAASAMSWPKWVDFKQLEHDFCGYQANSNNHTVDVSSSFAIAGVDNSGSASQEAPKLLLSSGTDLDTMDDPMVAEDTMAMTSLSLSDKPSSSPNLSPSSAPNDVQQQQTCSDMDCDQKPPISHLQSTSASGVHDMSPLPKQVCDTKPPPNPSGPLRVPSPPPPNHHQQQQQQQHQQTQEQPLDPMAGLAQPYTSSILTVLPFAPEHSRPIFPTRGARRTGWYRSKAVASRGLSAITGVDYTTTCWYNVEQLEQIIKESIAASPITETNPLDSRTFEALIDRPSDLAADKSAAA